MPYRPQVHPRPVFAGQGQTHLASSAGLAVSAPIFVPNYNQASDSSLLFQSSPKGPTISYKPQQFSVPPPSPNSPTLSCQSDNSMIMSTANSSFVSPPPPSGPACAPGQAMPSAQQQQQLGMTIDSIQVLPPMFQPQPLMSPQPYMSPCVRYTSFPLQQTMFSLALPDGQPGHMKTGLVAGPPNAPSSGHSPAPAMQLCQPVPEVGVCSTKYLL